ncbi:MAG: hypothetical protein JWN48_4712 [Myxococcaceae bacterium]|nr:hypothetical protein [Myxococcaceae bacterium]
MSRRRALLVGFLCTLGCGGDATSADGGTPVQHSDAATTTAPPVDGGARDDAATTLVTQPAQPTEPSGARLFPDGAWMYQPIDRAALDKDSAQVTRWLRDNGSFGTGEMRIDYSIEVLTADANTPLETFTPTDDFYTPDCDTAPFPVPAHGALEGEPDYRCTGDGDCHLLVVDRPASRLYEMWRADIEGSTFKAGCAVVWDMTRVYGPEGRGEQCSSADAAGLPIAPLLFSADEVAAGSIDHAIRFILPNDRMRAKTYRHPATHAGGPTAGGTAPIYGSRFRLRADFDLSTLPNEGARVVARALQRYGMTLADGGNIALTAQSDRSTAHKWDGLLGTHDLSKLQPTDFEVVDTGAPIALTYDCTRAQIAR